MKKNILFLSPDSLTNPCGGLGERLRNLLPLLNKEFNCFVLTQGDGGVYKGVVTSGIKDYKLPLEGLPIQITLSSFAEILIDKIGKPDFVVSLDHSTIFSGYGLALHHKAKWFVEYNLALFSYEKQYNPNTLDIINKAYSEQIHACEEFGSVFAHRVIMCSQFYSDEFPYVTRNGLTPVVIPNGIDLSEWKSKEVTYTFPGSCKTNLVYIGRLSSQKGVQDLIELKLPKGVALHFAGTKTGSNLYREVLEAVEEDENKFYLGPVFGEDKVNLLRSADAILFPSRHEPFGIVGLEAMASKTPLITTLVDGIKTYLDDSLCIKCDPSPSSIEKAIATFLSLSKEERNNLSNEAFKRVKDFTWESSAQSYTNLFNSY